MKKKQRSKLSVSVFFKFKLQNSDFSIQFSEFRFQKLVFGFFFHSSRNITFEHTCYAGCPAVDGVVVHL